MLKALDLLKEQYNILNNGIDGIWINPKKLDEAIKELEELQSRSCNNCKYVSSDTLGLIYCSSPKSPLSSCLFPIHPNFSCNKWEVKNECS